jgi:hypothetical protein
MQMLLDITKTSYDSLEKKYNSITTIKDEEIKRLNKVNDETNEYSPLWFAGGILGGITLTLAVVYAVDKVK